MTTTQTTTGLTSYYPEMGEPKPAAQIEARLSHYGRHWFLYTPLTLSGRGVEFLGVEKNGVTGYRDGWNGYKVTQRAFDLICQKYSVSSESLL